MDTCAVETGLLKKKPCGHPAVAKCANCEMALCSSHGIPVLSATKQKTGEPSRSLTLASHRHNRVAADERAEDERATEARPTE